MNNISVQIQCASEDDLSEVQSCAQAAYAKYIDRMKHVPAPMLADFAQQIELGQIHTARLKSGLAGFVVFYPRADHLHLENIAVYPCYAG